MAGESASFDDQDDVNNTPLILKNHDEHGAGAKLSEEIAILIEKLYPLPTSSRKCIYKLSDHIRKSNEEAYTPQVLSIGPFHRNNNQNLQTMDRFKWSCLKSFTERSETKLKDIVSTIKGAEESIRECYSENIPLESDDFVKMILLDATFIIEYFWKNWTKVNWNDYDLEILKPWLCNKMQMDLILLENQLPFFIIDKIYDTAFPSSRSKKGHPFIELCFSQFEYYNVQKFQSSGWEHEILHFTDLLRQLCMPPSGKRPERSSKNMKEMYSATQLEEVGLKFKISKPSNNRSPLELKYAEGVLEIPCFQLDNTTEIYARNLVAFEECHYRENPYITDYYILLSMLIKTNEDMDVLVREEIIDNWLDGVVATSMIKKLSGKRFYSKMNSDYQHIVQESDHFYANQSKLITITWRRVLFRTRLARVATISAAFGLTLTLVEALTSVLSLKSAF